jgi:hypothetical protein
MSSAIVPVEDEIRAALAAADEPVKIESRRNPPRACRARPLLTEAEKMKILLASDSESSDESFEGSDDDSDDEEDNEDDMMDENEDE